jgi:hypothetical protein
MKRFWAAAAACVAFMAAAPAWSKPIPEGGVTVQEVRTWLIDNGYKAQVETASDGDQHILSGADGLRFSIFFYDCSKGRCAGVQFYLGFDKGPNTPGIEEVNAWNRDKRFLKAYLDRDGDLAFEYDANVAPGGTWEALEDDFNVFLSLFPAAKALANW